MSSTIDSEFLTTLRYSYASLVTITLAFGAYSVMTGMTIHYLRNRRGSVYGHGLVFYYTIAMFLLTIANYYTSAKVLEALIIEVPAATSEAEDADSCGPNNIAGTVISLVQVLLSDGLMVYRAYILYDGAWLLVSLPILLWLALLGSSFPLALICAGQSAGGTLHIAPGLTLVTIFYSVTASLQLLTSGMIVVKLLTHRRVLRRQGLDVSHGTAYVSLAGVLAESAGVYAFATVAYIPMFRENNPAQIWWGQVVGSLVFLSPGWIMLRISMGMSFTRGSTSHHTGTGICFTSNVSPAQHELGDDSTMPRGADNSIIWDGKPAKTLKSLNSDIEMVRA